MVYGVRRVDKLHRSSETVYQQQYQRLVEEADYFISQQLNEGLREHGMRRVGVLEVVIRLSDHLQ